MSSHHENSLRQGSRGKMHQRKATGRVWRIILALALILFAYKTLCPPRAPGKESLASLDGTTASDLTRDDLGGFKNLRLDEHHCKAAFPNLTKEIDLAVAQGSFHLGVDDASASLLGQIKDNTMLILRAPRPADMSEQWKERQRAALHQINRAILTSPTRLPDTLFNLYIQDTPVSNSWSHSRPATSSSPRHTFPIPHFAFWAWNQPFIRSIPHAITATDKIEKELPFDRKDRRAVWRGTAWFNNGAGANPRSRQELMRITEGEKWADVQALDWKSNGEDAINALKIEDFCRHKYIIHTEGVSYSGRLQFHQLCESVIISPPIEWLQHTTHLVMPVYSSVLLGRSKATERDDSTKQPPEYPSPRARETWPATVRPGEANMVFVNPDWSDLEATINWLEDHPDVARGIAQRQRALFVGRGYLSPAAEVCYWRALIRGWSQVAHVDDGVWKNTDTVSWEEFSVRPEKTQGRF